tara:strand:- start:4807 stop:5145 length:339 start_codon:yes stop_codon:yes gene_type:complete
MNPPKALADEKKLSVTYRVEPGCLGPKGTELIDAFCEYAHQKIQTLDSDYINWNIIPRHDKKLPEMSYKVLGKSMNHTQAEKYLCLFGKSLDEFECHLSDKLSEFINEYMGH